jgi:hypothetical protein
MGRSDCPRQRFAGNPDVTLWSRIRKPSSSLTSCERQGLTRDTSQLAQVATPQSPLLMQHDTSRLSHR